MRCRRRSALGLLLSVLVVQLALSGFLAAQAPNGEMALGGLSPVVTPLAPSALALFEVDGGDGDPEPMQVRFSIDDGPDHSPCAVRPTLLPPWRAADALARAGRLSAPPTAPPLSMM